MTSPRGRSWAVCRPDRSGTDPRTRPTRSTSARSGPELPTDTIDRVEAGVLVQPGPRGAPLLVAFGGVAAGLGIPPFEFMRLTGELPVGRVFLRDLRQAWFQKGIADVGPRPADIAARLQALIDDLEPSRVVFTGNSAGAYAALLFG